MGLLLAAVDVDGPLTWRWLLSDLETGKPLADQSVRLGPASDDVIRFRDLYGYLDGYAAPDRWTEDGKRFVGLAGQWAGRELLGPAIGAAILNEAPVTVRVTAPAALREVLLWPLELAHVDGKPLALQGDVSFVYDIVPGATERRKNDVGAALRVLAVFSQPTETSVLALRRERYALSRLIRRIAVQGRTAVELRVAQYGVTRERLEEIADDQDGWDVLHLSGHGLGGAFLLEKPDGSPDVVPTTELIRLLRPIRRRVRLAVVSACESAVDATAETMRLLGLTEQAEAVEAAKPSGQPTRPEQGPVPQVPGLARALVSELDCAVVAMRYPVHDEFAIAYSDVFYEHLLVRRQPVDVAAARALAQASGAAPSMSRPAVSLATPGLFGRAAGLDCPAPPGRVNFNTTDPKMAYFDPPYGPGEPPRFVGRAAAMARAAAALAPDSGQTAVLLHGMAGSGKTTCAMELAYRNAERFGAVAFWQAPTKDDQWQGALENLASRLETQLGGYGFAMTGYIGSVQALAAFLPRLRRAMEDSGVLLVLDNLETLLAPGGDWRDPRWGPLITALTSHDGESRLILTSRAVPNRLGDGRVLTRPVHALSLQEAVALARELPNLRNLLHADVGAVRDPADDDPTDAERARLAADRSRVLRVLRVVQGHPKLMELADATAQHRSRLDTQLTAAEEAAVGQGLEAFFRDGESRLDPGQFLDTLKAWTVTALSALSPRVRLMAEFVACLEDDDRRSDIIEVLWPQLCRRLGRFGAEPMPEPAPDGPPATAPLLAALTAAALIESEPLPVRGEGTGANGSEQPGEWVVFRPADRPVTGGAPPLDVVRMHPGVAAAIMAQADQGVRAGVDAALAEFWNAVFVQAREQAGGEHSGLVMRAGLAAAPYLLRHGDRDQAGYLLDHAVARDGSPGTAQAVLPLLRRIAASTGAPKHAWRLGRVLMNVDAGEAERLLRGATEAAARAGDYWHASAAAGDLTIVLREGGRLADALAATADTAEFTRLAGLGPWTRLGNESLRLRILVLMGNHAQVLAETETLRAAMAAISPDDDAPEAVDKWNVREAILDNGRSSALASGDWQRCLDLNAEAVASKRQRLAGVHEVIRTRFNDAGPLIRLRRLAEAGQLLAECQRVFEDSADTSGLASVLSTRSLLEGRLGRWQTAADLERAALRLRYARLEPRNVAISHHNLATYVGRLGGDRAERRAHRLAAALIRQLSGMSHDVANSILLLAAEQDDEADGRLPATVAQVVAIAERTEGVRLGTLLGALQPDLKAVEDAFAEILRAVEEKRQTDIATSLQRWEEPIAAIVAACRERAEPSAMLAVFLDLLPAEQPDWTPLVAVLRRILTGERDKAALLADLDPTGAAIVRETLSRVNQPA